MHINKGDYEFVNEVLMAYDKGLDKFLYVSKNAPYHIEIKHIVYNWKEVELPPPDKYTRYKSKTKAWEVELNGN